MASVELRQAVQAGGIAVVDGSRGLLTRWFLDGLSSALATRGHPVQRERRRDVQVDPGVRVVINAVDAEHPISFRRRSKEIFVVGVAEVPALADEMLAAGYSLLVRTLSNVFIPIARDERRHRGLLHHDGAGVPSHPARRATTPPSSRRWWSGSCRSPSRAW